MKAVVFHLGISSPPEIDGNIDFYHTPVIEVSYHARIEPREISQFMHISPVILILSQNGVKGLKKWINYYDLQNKYFNIHKFWTVGERTHECLQNELNICSSFPEIMTGAGALQKLQLDGASNVLLISGEELRSEFILSLSNSGMNYYHFPVYETQIIDNEVLRFSFENILDNYLIFTSPSTVDGFLQNLDTDDFGDISARCVSIGSTTSRYICEKKGKVFMESEVPSINNLYHQLSTLILNPIL